MILALARLPLLLLWTLLCMPIQAVCLRLPGQAKVRFAQVYWAGMARILGLNLTLRGTLEPRRPLLFIANHCSWLDIILLGAALPGCFVAKGEIARWPLISRIAKLGRTLFVSRARGTLTREQSVFAGRLAAGDSIILFPEGTTSDGTRILPLASSFLALAEGPGAPAIQPVTLVYDAIDGLPVQRRDRPDISWYGDMDLAPHYFRAARHRGLHATLVLDAVIAPGTFPNRKALAEALGQRLAENAAALRQHRAVTPRTWNGHGKILDTARGTIAE